ncbi:hypothetical protein [Nocardia sp. NPDC050435]|uniref:hypothetical protein n=1 Tax=Nocardia sp. NPDC050435 TaxID=3155040 RepID=UPI0033D751CE
MDNTLAEIATLERAAAYLERAVDRIHREIGLLKAMHASVHRDSVAEAIDQAPPLDETHTALIAQRFRDVLADWPTVAESFELRFSAGTMAEITEAAELLGMPLNTYLQGAAAAYARQLRSADTLERNEAA